MMKIQGLVGGGVQRDENLDLQLPVKLDNVCRYECTCSASIATSVKLKTVDPSKLVIVNVTYYGKNGIRFDCTLLHTKVRPQ
jgi:hypothetical protein